MSTEYLSYSTPEYIAKTYGYFIQELDRVQGMFEDYNIRSYIAPFEIAHIKELKERKQQLESGIKAMQFLFYT